MNKMTYKKMMKERRMAGAIIILGIIIGIIILLSGLIYLNSSLLMLIGLLIIVFSILYGSHKWKKAIYQAQINRIEMRDKRMTDIVRNRNKFDGEK